MLPWEVVWGLYSYKVYISYLKGTQYVMSHGEVT